MHPYLHIDAPLGHRFQRSCKPCIDFGITSIRILPFRTHTFTRSWTCIRNFIVASALLTTVLYPAAAKTLFLPLFTWRSSRRHTYGLLLKCQGFKPLWIFCVLSSIRLRILYYNSVMYQCRRVSHACYQHRSITTSARSVSPPPLVLCDRV